MKGSTFVNLLFVAAVAFNLAIGCYDFFAKSELLMASMCWCNAVAFTSLQMVYNNFFKEDKRKVVLFLGIFTVGQAVVAVLYGNWSFDKGTGIFSLTTVPVILTSIGMFGTWFFATDNSQ